ncbi:MAG: Mor transcription activator family protein [Verrucomicrobiota bacterium]|nr:Mor transcription activator family protein [Verrucomicrobiota bacterium]
MPFKCRQNPPTNQIQNSKPPPGADGLGPVIDLVGFALAIELMRLRGGQRIRIPHAPGADHWLCTSLGAEAARKLGWYYGGSILLVPAGRSTRNVMRDREIYQLHQQNASAPQIARRFGVTERLVRQIVSSYRRQPAQPIAKPVSAVPGFNSHQITLVARRFGISREAAIERLNQSA